NTLDLVAARLPRQRQLDLEGVVDFDGLSAQQRRGVPALLQRVDHGAVHERQALQHAAIAHHALGADHALHDHQALDLPLPGLLGVDGVRPPQLLRRAHRVVELDGPGADLSPDLAAHDAAHHAADHATLHAAFHALLFLGLLFRDLGRLLLDLGDLLRLDHGG